MTQTKAMSSTTGHHAKGTTRDNCEICLRKEMLKNRGDSFTPYYSRHSLPAGQQKVSKSIDRSHANSTARPAFVTRGKNISPVEVTPGKTEGLRKARKTYSNYSTINVAANSIAREVISKSVGKLLKQEQQQEEKEEEDNSTEITPEGAMAPNHTTPSSGEDSSTIISGHRIALSVQYDGEGAHTVTNHGEEDSCSMPEVAVDEQVALMELDKVIDSAQGTPEHFVDAVEDLEYIVEGEQELEVPDNREVLSHSPLQSSYSLKGPASPDSSPLGSPTNSGSSTSVDGTAVRTSQSSYGSTGTAEMIITQNQYLNGPDQVIPAEDLKTWLPNGAVSLKMGDHGVSSHKPLSVPTLLKKTAQKFPNLNALMEKKGEKWVGTTYSDYYSQVRTMAKAFIKLGLEPYHGVCILGFNSSEWFISDLAAIFAGGFAAGIYTTNSAEACEHCAKNCQAQIWVVEDQKQLDKVLKIKDNVPSLKTIIQYKGKPTVDGVMGWDEVMEIGKKENDEMLEERLRRIAVNQCCTLIYTSGTTGPPKGVMLSHDNITWTALSVSIFVGLQSQKETAVSYLPLSHIAAQMIDIYVVMINASTTYFARPDALKGSLVETLKEVRPTAFLGVPRVWEKIYEKMMDVGKKTKGLKKSIATWAKSLGLETNERKQRFDFSKPLGYSVASAVVFKNIKKALGLDRCNVFLSGAAPIAPEIVKYFHSLDICLTEIYGMSESSGPHTSGVETAFRVGSAGKTVPGAQTIILKPDADGNGEICMEGRHIAMGYLLNEEKTHEAIDDQGLLHSGDIGKVDSDGFLFITGRLKELIITAGGENIPPVLIEDLLKGELPCISNAMLIGDRRKFLSILLTLKTNMNIETGDALDTLSPACIEWCESVGSSAKNIYDVLSGPDPKIMRAIQDGIDRTNAQASSNAQKVQKWTILPRDFTIPGDELGPTMKLKRPVVVKKYAETIERFYQ